MSEEPKIVQLLSQLRLSHPMTLCTTISMAFLWFLSAMPTLSPAFLAPDDNNSNQSDFISVQVEFNLDTPTGLLHPAELTTSIFFIGNLILGQVPCIVADRIGRRPVVVFSVFVTGLAGVLGAVSPNFYILLLFRFIQGIFFTSLIMINWVLCCESLAPDSHKIAAMMFGTFWVAGYMGMAPVAKWSTDWRQIQFISSLPSFLFAFFLAWYLPESPAFLATKGRAEELEKFISRANRTKKIPISYNVEETLVGLSNRGRVSLLETLKDILRSAETLLHLGTSIIIWMCDFLMYGTMALTATGVGNDPYVSFMFSGLAELPCYIIIPYLLDWIGRRPCVIGVHLLSALAFSLLILIPTDSTYWLYIWLIAKFGVSSAFQCCFIYGVEIFPVEKRNICLGICATLANIGAFLSPHMDILDEFYEGGAFITFFGLCLLSSACTTLLPETKPLAPADWEK